MKKIRFISALILAAAFTIGTLLPFVAGKPLTVTIYSDGFERRAGKVTGASYLAQYEGKRYAVYGTVIPKTSTDGMPRKGRLWAGDIYLNGINFYHMIVLLGLVCAALPLSIYILYRRSKKNRLMHQS